MQIIINSLVSLLFFWSTTQHPIHRSISEVEYKKQSKSVQISHKLFIEDIELAIEFKYGVSLNIGTKKEHKNILKYLNEHKIMTESLLDIKKNICSYLTKYCREIKIVPNLVSLN